MSQTEVPEYRVIAPEGAFCAPDLLPLGTVLRTWMAPGPQFEPLNDAAKARFEEWLEEQHPDADRFDRRPLKNADGSPVMWKPHAPYRRAAPTDAKASAVEVIARPEKKVQANMSLAEIMAGADKKGGDQRPPPVHIPPVAADGKVKIASPFKPEPNHGAYIAPAD